MLLLVIYLDLQLTHLESKLSQFMSLCGLSFVSLLCLAFTIACQAELDFSLGASVLLG